MRRYNERLCRPPERQEHTLFDVIPDAHKKRRERHPSVMQERRSSRREILYYTYRNNRGLDLTTIITSGDTTILSRRQRTWTVAGGKGDMDCRRQPGQQQRQRQNSLSAKACELLGDSTHRTQIDFRDTFGLQIWRWRVRYPRADPSGSFAAGFSVDL